MELAAAGGGVGAAEGTPRPGNCCDKREYLIEHRAHLKGANRASAPRVSCDFQANNVAALNRLHIEKILASRVGDGAWILRYWLSSTRGRITAAAAAHVRSECFSLLLVCHVVC